MRPLVIHRSTVLASTCAASTSWSGVLPRSSRSARSRSLRISPISVPAGGDAALGDPPLDGLGVYLRSIGQLVGGLAPLEQERSQPFVAHLTDIGACGRGCGPW